LPQLTRGLAVTACLAVLAACGGGGSHTSAEPPTTSHPVPEPDRAGKVVVIVEENETDEQIFGPGKDTPYLKQLAAQYATAANLQAAYPPQCPSLAAYLILTSGGDHGICDDKGPKKHQLTGPTVFSQVKDRGREWRVYAESMPHNCALDNDGHFAARHTAAPYYVDIAADCRTWDIPMGALNSGALHDDIAAGRLPAFSLAIPDTCHDMHGSHGCKTGLVRAADDWLHDLVPQLTSGPDWRSGRLTVVITWDEGSKTDNHIPTLVLTPHASGVRAQAEANQCSLLRLISDVVQVPPLGCAAEAPSLTAVFGLRPQS
jgi:hypothetical protein